MQMQSINRDERGIAMMVALFALLLLSVVGLGMMYSTNMETAINGNYRDKQAAFYAALAGLQEGRERIRNTAVSGTATYSVTPPSLLPSASGQNVIYIVAKASTVIPYLYSATNPYFDTELCQENLTNITITAGMVGAPCSWAYSTSMWYSIVDDSQSSSAPWNLTYPLDWKWTRITLKGNNMTQYPVNGTASDGSQTCWNGTYQMSTPLSYSTGCQPKGGVTAVFVTNSGSGYTSTGPTVTICGTDTAGMNGCPTTNLNPGTGATASVSAMTQGTTGYVSVVTLTTGGSGYATAPTVTITGDGTGATATATLSATGSTVTNPGSVIIVSLTTGGAGYTTAPTVSFSGGGGSGATATATLATSGGTTTINSSVGTITLSNAGKGYTSAPTVTLSGGGGSGATATATLNTLSGGEVASVTLPTLAGDGTDPCFAQASDVVIAFSGGGGSGASASGVLETTRSCMVSFTNMPVSNCRNALSAANGYSPADQKSGVTFTNLPNFSGTLSVSSTSNDKAPTGVTVQKPGYNTTRISGGSTYADTFELYNNGSSTSAWPIHNTHEDCNNLTFTGNTGFRLASITVNNGGSGYTSVPTVTISGGAGSTYPTPTATLGYPISVSVGAGGSGYTSGPTVSFSGGQPSGCSSSLCTSAVGTATLGTTTAYPVASITLTAGGSGYTSNPTVSFSGGGGSGAAATATASDTNTTTYSVASVTLTCSSTSTTSCIGYTNATVSFSGGGGSGAAATATIAPKYNGTYSVLSIAVNGSPSSGSGYTSNPIVMITGGGGSGATAQSVISGGTKFGQVYVLTSLAQTSTGARSMLQMEVASPVLGYSPGGALTLDGPAPTISALPNSSLYTVSGIDANTCHDSTSESNHPAIDAYDNPNNPTNPSAVTDILNAIPSGRTGNYIGSGSSPSVQNGYAALGPTMNTPGGLSQLIGNIETAPGGAADLVNKNVGVYGAVTGYIAPSVANITCTGNCSSVTNFGLGSCPGGTTTPTPAACNTVIDVVKGNLTLKGSGTGYGILVVEGSLAMDGSFSWYGPIFVVGDGNFSYGGGGNGQIQGNLLVANIWTQSTTSPTYPNTAALLGANNMGSPSINWNGGGGNGIQYDHCWTTDLMNNISGTYTSNIPEKILSFRVLPY